MKEMLLAVVMVLIFTIGYFMAGGIDRFVERSRRARMGALEEERGDSEAGERIRPAARWTFPKGRRAISSPPIREVYSGKYIKKVIL